MNSRIRSFLFVLHLSVCVLLFSMHFGACIFIVLLVLFTVLYIVCTLYVHSGLVLLVATTDY